MIFVAMMCWVATMSLAAWRHRPRPAPIGAPRSPFREHTLDAGLEVVAAPRPTVERHLALIEQLGSVVQDRVPVLVALPARVLGAAVAVGALLVVIAPGWALIGSLATGMAVWWQQRSAVRRRQRRVERALPAFVEMLRVSIDAGLSTRLALVTVSPLSSDEIRPSLQRALLELERGVSLVEVLDGLGARLGASALELTTVLAGAERSGAPLGSLLGRFADDLRRVERVSAEARARRLPVLLLVPLVFCVLPAFAMVAVVPMLVTGTTSFSFPSP